MGYSLFDFVCLIGALGLFLYGMKIMSEGLQKVAGEKMRSILSAMTSNRLFGVFTGILITALIQSSSATTLMAVSFVNASLLTLAQSISVIMGANVGTTVTAWIISLFGFKVSIDSFAIPLIAFTIPLLFSSKSRWKSWGEFIIGFALLFLGLSYLKQYMPDLQGNPEALAFLRRYTDMGYSSVLLFLGIGSLMTVVVQSSSATVAITLIMCSKGWIPFEMAAAMVLGENIGTTITANVAAIGTSAQAKRAAFSHFLFNVFGVIWVLLLFFPFTNFIAELSQLLGQQNPNTLFNEITSLSKQYDPATMSLLTANESISDPFFASIQNNLASLVVSVSFGLALFHTMFNICNVLLMIWFVPVYVRICNWVIKSKESEDPHLQFVSFGMLSTSELSLLQVKKELVTYVTRVRRMLDMDREMLSEKDANKFNQHFNRIEKYENICDRMEVEIANYLNKLSEGRLSSDAKEEVRVMMRATTEIESTGDACFNIARALRRRNEAKGEFTPELEQQVRDLMQICDRSLENLLKLLDKKEHTQDDAHNAYNIENEINHLRDDYKIKNIEDVNAHRYPYQVAVYYMDIVDECEKLGDYVLNAVQAIVEKKI